MERARRGPHRRWWLTLKHDPRVQHNLYARPSRSLRNRSVALSPPAPCEKPKASKTARSQPPAEALSKQASAVQHSKRVLETVSAVHEGIAPHAGQGAMLHYLQAEPAFVTLVQLAEPVEKPCL